MRSYMRDINCHSCQTGTPCACVTAQLWLPRCVHSDRHAYPFPCVPCSLSHSQFLTRSLLSLLSLSHFFTLSLSHSHSVYMYVQALVAYIPTVHSAVPPVKSCIRVTRGTQ